MSPRRFGLLLGAVALAALTWRVSYVLTVTRHQQFPTGLSDHALHRSFDEHYYESGARSLADGHWFRFSFFGPEAEQAEHPPLTSAILATVALTTDRRLPMRLMGALGGTATVVVIGLVGRLAGGDRTGIVAGAFAAVYPNLWVNDGLLLAETWAALATALTVLATYRLLRSPTWVRAAVAGGCTALAMLARSELMLLIPLVVVPAILFRSPVARARRIWLVAVAVVSAGLVASPWVLYNLSRFEEPVFVTTGDGGVLIGANCDSTYSGSLIGFWNGLCGLDDPRGAPGDASVGASRDRAAAFEYIGDHLGRLPIVMAARLGRTWSVYRQGQMADISQAEGRPLWASYAGLAMYWLLVVLASVGVVTLRRSGTSLIPLIGPLVMVTINAMVAYGLVRFRISAEGPLVVLGAAGACSIVLRHPRFSAAKDPSCAPGAERGRPALSG